MPVERFVVVTGLPRSGTTVLAAQLDAHSQLELFFEPFNAHKANPPAIAESAAQFRSQMAKLYGLRPRGDVRATGFKETTISAESIDWMERAAAAAARELPVSVIWIVRDPVHVALSLVDGARKWWGHTEMRFDAQSFTKFLQGSERSLAKLTPFFQRHGGAIVSYEALAEAPERELARLMPVLGLAFEPGQLDYHSRGNQERKVMGDLGVAREPKPMNADSIRQRDAEAAELRAEIDPVLARHGQRLAAFSRAIRAARFATQLPG
jgi:hypothetical protein